MQEVFVDLWEVLYVSGKFKEHWSGKMITVRILTHEKENKPNLSDAILTKSIERLTTGIETIAKPTNTFAKTTKTCVKPIKT